MRPGLWMAGAGHARQLTDLCRRLLILGQALCRLALRAGSAAARRVRAPDEKHDSGEISDLHQHCADHRLDERRPQRTCNKERRDSKYQQHANKTAKKKRKGHRYSIAPRARDRLPNFMPDASRKAPVYRPAPGIRGPVFGFSEAGRRPKNACSHYIYIRRWFNTQHNTQDRVGFLVNIHEAFQPGAYFDGAAQPGLAASRTTRRTTCATTKQRLKYCGNLKLTEIKIRNISNFH